MCEHTVLQFSVPGHEIAARRFAFEHRGHSAGMYDTFFPGKDGEYLTLKRRFFAKEILPLQRM